MKIQWHDEWVARMRFFNDWFALTGKFPGTEGKYTWSR